MNVGTIDEGLSPNVVAPQSRALVDVRVRLPKIMPVVWRRRYWDSSR